MLLWLADNIATIIAAVIIAVIVTLIIVNMIKNKKRGKPSCGCGCENCAMSGACHPKNQ